MPDHWQEATLGDVADVVSGGTPKTKVAEYWGGDIVWVTPTEVVAQEGRIVTSSNRMITPEGLDGSSAKMLPVDAVLLTSRATIGAVALAGVPLATNQGFASLVCGDQILPRFAMYWCQANTHEMVSRAGGNTFLEISRKKVAAIPLSVPPLAEQRRIVDLVGSIDTYIDSLETQIEATRTARSALLSELLSNPGDDWQETTLGEAFDIRMGRQRSPKNASGTHMVSYLRAANVKDGELLLGDVKQMNFSPEEQATFRLEPGDVLVTEGCGSREEVGASARWNSELAGVVCFQNTLLRMRQVDGTTSAGFAEVVARYFYSNGRWADVASGTNIFHIGANRAVAMPFDLPPLAEQQRIVDLVGSFDEQISSLESQVESVRALRSGVLSELLSGERLLDESYDMAVGL